MKQVFKYAKKRILGGCDLIMNLKKNFLMFLIISMCFLLFIGTALAEPIKINFWHAMSGSRLGVLESIVEGFNELNTDYEVVPLFTGSYAETLTKFIASYPTGTAPHMVQVYEVGTQTMIDSEAITPVYQIPEMLGETWDWAQYVIPITHYYSVDGNLWSMPLILLQLCFTTTKIFSKKLDLTRINHPQLGKRWKSMEKKSSPVE